MRKTLLMVALLLSAARLTYADEIPAAQASSHAGETATLCGNVTGIHTAAGSKGKPTALSLKSKPPDYSVGETYFELVTGESSTPSTRLTFHDASDCRLSATIVME
jgi:hypothetical protein